MSKDERASGGPAEAELRMLDSLDAPAPQRPVAQYPEVEAWLASLSDKDVRRVVCSRELSEAVAGDVLAIRSKAALRHIMILLGIAPATLSPALQPPNSRSREGICGANVILFSPRPKL
ncbi:hypothetical protein QA645_19460 [Bradyrhizobium sp. CIAT3101]|uniref:hypothetical protein n=1 Tax=Bradyrhizobium sp. CIAT3101 TaxID=439387 RepID=UPI0024B1C876|nr:hypothetical protein [Bradyrhizobium sp. CIAT3101]WFU84834.1 hypothetical protein QA645_19460 [Bradyrhizobium sp. CIAT3101]